MIISVHKMTVPLPPPRVAFESLADNTLQLEDIEVQRIEYVTCFYHQECHYDF